MGSPAPELTVVRRLFPGWTRDLAPWTRGNLIAGLTVTAYLVPQVMAYATVAGLPAIVGLWASLPALVIYALMGSSRVLSLGPESSVALMTAAVIAPLVAGDPGRYAALAAGLAAVVGLIGLIGSLLRVAFISDLLSRPVLVGYMAGIGVLMIDGQLDSFLGIDTEGDTLFSHLSEVVSALPTANLAVVALAVAVLVLLFVLARTYPRLPGPLIAVVVAAILAAVLVAWGAAIPLVGTVPQGLPTPTLPALPDQDLELFALAAAGVVLVGFTDTVLTGRAFRQRHEDLDTTTELRSMSLANIATGFLQGMPVSSSGSRTALARTSGATSQGYSLVTAAGLLLVLLVAAPALSTLPRAGLAALVIFAALQLIDVGEFRALWRFSRTEFALAVVTCAAVLVVGILNGVLVAVALSVLAMLARVARPQAAALGFVRGVPGMHDINDFDDVAEVEGLLVFRYDSPLFFANANDFTTEAMRMATAREPGLDWFALNCEAIITIDSTAAAALTSLISDLTEAGVTFCLVRAKRELLDQLDDAGMLARIGEEHIYPTLPTLVEAFRAAHPNHDA
jgi:SulP family sulfate permease